MKHLCSIAVFSLLLIALPITAQNTLSLNGLNEAKFTYRAAEDSLNVYFRDSFAFNLAYRNFAFGMKFIAELPKYSTSQAEMIDELAPANLDLGWKEIYVSYQKDAWLIYAGTIDETLGTGLIFRSYEDIEFDRDNRLTGFKLGYDDVLRLKALYGAITSGVNASAKDISYGIDAEYPMLPELAIGTTLLTSRDLTATGNYSQTDLIGGRAKYAKDRITASAEFGTRHLFDRGSVWLNSVRGFGAYAAADISFDNWQAGIAGKYYDKFQLRLQDIPLANHHNETLADNQASGVDEQGLQGWITWNPFSPVSLNLDYAEAWNAEWSKRMNDLYAALEITRDNDIYTFSYSHIEKKGSDPNSLGQPIHYWQREIIPAFSAAVTMFRRPVTISGEFKLVDKDHYMAAQGDYLLEGHYEPKLQVDVALRKFSLSVGTQSNWEDFGAIMDSRYWLNAEAKIPFLGHSDLLLFAGKEAGGKVCRNGVCRYVAPFAGVRAEVSTRF
jgi:hypothetical protein